ncbi:MAG TPA: NTP transferase domain-containing protein [Wenzhouxiangella sp.]
MSERNRCDVLVLAGDRTSNDPLAKHFGVAGKALVPLGGVALLERVLQVIEQWPATGRVVLVAPNLSDYREVVERTNFSPKQLLWIEPRPTLYQSIEAALAVPDYFEGMGLVVSADHGLLKPQWLTQVTSSLNEESDLVVAMANWSEVMMAYPGNRRTRYRFSDQSLCGGNLFAFRMPGFLRVLARWHSVEQDRKKPWRMLTMLGVGNLVRYLSGRLSSDDAFLALSKIANVNVHAEIVNDPSIAVDVDGFADLELAEAILSQRTPDSGVTGPC